MSRIIEEEDLVMVLAVINTRIARELHAVKHTEGRSNRRHTKKLVELADLQARLKKAGFFGMDIAKEET